MFSKDMYFHEYFKKWVELYKEGTIRKVTLQKYKNTYWHIAKLAPSLKLCDLNRMTYQKLINDYALTHEKQTVQDFHTQVKASIADALNEELIDKNPVYKITIKGKAPREKKPKFLNEKELTTLLATLNLGETPNRDWFLLLLAKTGLRFSEGLGLTPKDFDFQKQTLEVNKTWNYKENGGFALTKNKSSMRKIVLDWQTSIQFSQLLKDIPEDQPIFINQETNKAYNSTFGTYLSKKCKQAGVPEIGIHGLRHTHASILLKEGVSIASVARRLGHADMTTTQKVYLHVIQELEDKDNLNVMKAMAGL